VAQVQEAPTSSGLNELTALSSEPPRKPAPTSRRCPSEQCHVS
jgi:hypothetical protein